MSSSDRVVRLATASLAIATLVLAAKAGAWWVSGSVALLADALESALDVATGTLLLGAVHYASQPPDREHPFGHGKVEYFSAGFQGALVFSAGVGIAIEAARSFGRPLDAPSLTVGLGLSVFATACNVLLAVVLIREGRRLGSPALEADGRHDLADVVTTVGSWLGLALAWATGWWVLDPLVALLVAGHILWTGTSLAREAFAGLMDTALDDEELERLRSALDPVLPAGTRIVRLRTRRSARRVFADCILRVPGTTTVRASHAICDRLESAGRDAIENLELTVHVEPEG